MTSGRMSIDKAIALFQEAMVNDSCYIPGHVTAEYEALDLDFDAVLECIMALTPEMVDKDDVSHRKQKPGWHYAFRTVAEGVPIYLKFRIWDDPTYGHQLVELTSVHESLD